MTTIHEQLDQLAEFQAQRDLIEMQKSDLLNSVKIPAEVLAAQEEANKRRQYYDTRLEDIRKEIEARAKAEIEAVPMPELPAKYLRAFDEARQKRAEIQSLCQNDVEAAILQTRETKAKVDAELTAKVGTIYAQVETRKREISDEFGAKVNAVNANIDALTDEIKRAVVAEGHSVKGKVFHAVYAAGRVSWNTDMLDGMVIAFPALEKARKVGQPSVTLRKL